MNERTLSHYLKHSVLTEKQIHNELLKYRWDVTERTIAKSYRRWIVFQKKRRDLERRRINKGWKNASDFINNQIEKGEL